MSAYYYSLCRRFHGKPVFIRTNEGRSYRGIIQHVDKRHVYLQPMGSKFHGGFGYGFYAPKRNLGTGIILGSIITLALLPFFFW